MKIVIPTDFSEAAASACDYAVLWARALNAEVELIHVYTPAVTRNNVAYALISEEIARERTIANEKLEALSKEIFRRDGILCTYQVLIGNMVDELIREAEESKADLIAMGTTGSSGIDQVLFGSNAAAVIENASCPVLAIPKHVTTALPEKIVFATNYQDNDMQTLKELTGWAEKLRSELMILHVTSNKIKSERDLIESFSKEVTAETGFKSLYYYVLPQPHEDVEKGIGMFVDSVQVDVIALSTRKRGVFERLFNPSLTKKMAYHAQVPLLAFHATEAEDHSS